MDRQDAEHDAAADTSDEDDAKRSANDDEDSEEDVRALGPTRWSEVAEEESKWVKSSDLNFGALGGAGDGEREARHRRQPVPEDRHPQRVRLAPLASVREERLRVVRGAADGVLIDRETRGAAPEDPGR